MNKNKDDMELDYTVPSNKIIERKLIWINNTRTWQFTTAKHINRKRRNEQCLDLIKKLISGTDLQNENIGDLVSIEQKRNDIDVGKAQIKEEDCVEIKDEFVPDIITIDDDSDFEGAISKRHDSGLDSSSYCSWQLQEAASELIDSVPPSSFYRENDEYSEDNSKFWEPPELAIDEIYMVPLTKRYNESWVKAKLVTIHCDSTYELITLRTKQTVRVAGRFVALKDPPSNYLMVGSRAIALFKAIAETGEIKRGRGVYELGVVAETPHKENESRYLIIFDNGYWLYVHPKKIRPVFHTPKHVWMEVPEWNKHCVKSYLQNFYRPMIEFNKGQLISVYEEGRKTDKNDHACKVIAIDASLVLAWYRNISRTEWIHRGSPRLKTIDNVH